MDSALNTHIQSAGEQSVSTNDTAKSLPGTAIPAATELVVPDSTASTQEEKVTYIEP